MIFRFPDSIKSRLFLLAVLGTLPLVLLILAHFYEERVMAKLNAAQHAMHLSALASSAEMLQIRSAEQLLKTLSVVPAVRDLKGCDEFMADLLKQNPRYANVGVLDVEGNLVCSGVPFTSPVSGADRLYFRNAVHFDGFAVGEYQIGRVTRIASLNAGYPIKDAEGKLRGVLFAAMDLRWINGAIEGVPLPPETTAFILDDKGVILAHYPSPEAWIGKNAQNKDIAKLILAEKKEGTVEMAGLDGVERQFAYAPLPSFYGSGEAFVAVGIPTEVAVAGITPQLFRNLLILMLAVTTMMLIGNVGSERLVISRLRELTDATKLFARKQFSVRVKENRDDEIGTVVKTFNAMAEQLEGLYGKLEQKVAQKTRQLQIKVNELDAQKKLLEALLDNLPVGVIVAKSPKGNILMTNRMVKDMFQSQAKNGFLRDYVFADENGKPVPTNENPIYETISKGALCVNRTGLFFNKPDGRTVALRVSSALVKNGQESTAVIVIDDMTKELAIDKAKSEFVSLASHQLRTPLTATNWFCEMLLDGTGGKLTKRQHELLAQLYDSNRRMVALVNSLLNVSRIEAGKFSIEPSIIDLPEFVDGLLSEYHHRIENKRLLVETDYDDVDGYRGDPKLIRIILENYLLNAINYTPDKGRITITLAKTDTEIHISIKDTGYGIPKGEQAKIFSKLFRGSNIRKVETEGSGLGLYLVKTLVEQVGGRVWFESVEKKGSVFFAALPIEGMTQRKGTAELI